MSKARVERPSFMFNRGINTDASLLSFPADFTVDEENFDLMIDGSRRRRLGLSADSTSSTSVDLSVDDVARSFKWSNVGGDPDINFVVLQLGSELRFFTDDFQVGNKEKTFTIDLLDYKVEDTPDSDVESTPVDMTFGRGHLFVVGTYVEPFYVVYDADADTITINPIDILERDFEGIPDGVDNTTTPTTLTTAYNYNLLNSGWRPEDITAFETAHSLYPSKNMLSYYGYRRAVVAGFAEEDGTKEFSPEKLINELFQDAPAPKGHFIRNPFQTESVVVSDTSAGVYVPFSAMLSAPEAPGPTVITVTTVVPHGLSPGDTFSFYKDGGPVDIKYTNLSGLVGSKFFTGVITAEAGTAGSTIVFNDEWPGNFDAIVSYPTAGSIYSTDNVIENTNGFVSPNRPACVAFFAGRIWYAGIDYNKLSGKIFFSQTIESELQYGRCYQAADPTDVNISDIVATDGGVLNIPEMAQVFKIVPYSASLLVFAANGIWEIGPGSNGYFTAVSYSIRKISDIGTDGPGSVVIAEAVPFFWGKAGVYVIEQDANSGYLVSRPLSIGIIDTLFNSLVTSAKQNVQSTYDSLHKRIMWMYQAAVDDVALPATKYNLILLYDIRHQAFVKWRLATAPSLAVSLFCIKSINSNDPTQNIKVVADAGSTVTINGFIDIEFVDWDTTSYSSYLVTGYDTFQSPTRFKYAPLVYVFSKKTETGFTEVGDELSPIRPGSLTMQARWNWADHTNAGKWGTSQQVYRHRRLYVPSEVDPANDFNTGEPIIVTRNKVRGRGRSLHLLFSSTAGMDAHIVGWAITAEAMTDN